MAPVQIPAGAGEKVASDLAGRRLFLLGTPGSFTTYKWIATRCQQYGRKGEESRISKSKGVRPRGHLRYKLVIDVSVRWQLYIRSFNADTVLIRLIDLPHFA